MFKVNSGTVGSSQVLNTLGFLFGIIERDSLVFVELLFLYRECCVVQESEDMLFVSLCSPGWGSFTHFLIRGHRIPPC